MEEIQNVEEEHLKSWNERTYIFPYQRVFRPLGSLTIRPILKRLATSRRPLDTKPVIAHSGWHPGSLLFDFKSTSESAQAMFVEFKKIKIKKPEVIYSVKIYIFLKRTHSYDMLGDLKYQLTSCVHCLALHNCYESRFSFICIISL